MKSGTPSSEESNDPIVDPRLSLVAALARPAMGVGPPLSRFELRLLDRLIRRKV